MYNDLFGLETICFRYFNVYGPRQPVKGQYAPVVGLFLKQWRGGKPMTIVGDGLQRRDFTHVLDVVEANLIASTTTNSDALGQVFNVGTGTNHSVLELSQAIGSGYEHIPPRIGEAENTLADITKIKTLLGWEPKRKFMDYVSQEVEN
tara:strand:- start:466 stop:909 length:444 start_codon:yes stop_codon:yes gene_type:complete